MRGQVFLLAIAFLAVARPLTADEWDAPLKRYRELAAKAPRDRKADETEEMLRLGDRLYRWAKRNEENPRTTEILWTLCEGRPLGAQAAGAIQLLLTRDLHSPRWALLCGPIADADWSDGGGLGTDAILTRLKAESAQEIVWAAAQWHLARRELAAAAKVDPLDIKEVAARQQSALVRLRELAAARTPLLLEGVDFRDLAKGRLDLLQRNALGVRAPEVAGQDLHGEPLSLLSYRGKIVVLIFWGAWCPICREQFPAEKALAEKMADKPVVLLGVNSDMERSVALKMAKEEGLHWPSYWDEGSTRGPIARQWGVEGWPTVILLDHRGVIRYRFPGMPGVDKAVEILLKEL